jgi:ribosomal RNA assembly protein
MTEFQYDIKIPKERIAVVIGKKGEIKREIEQDTNTRLEIDSKEGDVFIFGEDGLGLFTAKEVIKAIARGFNPEIALLLLRQDYIFEIIDITEYAGKEKNNFARIKGRIIGREGKTRNLIEQLSECYVSVYGKTVSVIGTSESIAIARQCIEMLLKGAPHSAAYKFLEKKRSEIKRRKITGLQ